MSVLPLRNDHTDSDEDTSSNGSIDLKIESQKSSETSIAPALLAFEATVRDIQTQAELLAHISNAPRRFLPYRQAFFLKRVVKGGNFVVASASSIPVVDRDSPMVRWVEKLVANLGGDIGFAKQCQFSLPAYCDASDEEVSTYPFGEFLWTPLQDGKTVVGGMLTAKETPWAENEEAMATWLAEIYVHAWRSVKGAQRIVRNRLATRKRTLALLGAVFVAGAWPVSITALAPAEVSPQAPFVVAAPFDGVVKEILVDQNETVSAGDPLIQFEDIERRNAYEVAVQSEAVAQARFQRASQGAISDPREKREIAIAKAELDLARAEKEYAADLLEKTKLTAPREGLAIYTDKRDWVGRPVAAGEAILQLADPNEVRFTIDLPVKESLVLEEGARIKVFLDSDPLNPLEATLTEASYQARTDKRNILSYRISASLSEDTDTIPRIGVQGTARIHGQKAPLAYAMLRRPFASLRQMTGW